MKKLILVIIIIFIGGLFFWSRDSQQGAPRGGEPVMNLTVLRSDSIADRTVIQGGASQLIIGFTVTNHSATSTYALENFAFYPGFRSQVEYSRVTRLSVMSSGTKVAEAPVLAMPANASSTAPHLIPPGSSQNFELRVTLPLSASTTDFQIALGGIDAFNTDETEAPEPVYKEIDGRVLGSPYSSSGDESLESALLFY